MLCAALDPHNESVEPVGAFVYGARNSKTTGGGVEIDCEATVRG